MKHDSVRPSRIGMESGHERRLLLHTVILRAMRAILLCGPRRAARLAGAQVLDRSLQLAGKGLVSRDRLAGLLQLLLEGLAHNRHALRRRPRAVPCLEKTLDLMEREPGFLQKLDPADPGEGGLIVETESTVAARHRVKQVQLFVKPKGADRFPG